MLRRLSVRRAAPAHPGARARRRGRAAAAHRLPRGAILLALFLAGCATVSGRSQRVAVDATPRGAVVRDAEGAELGRTPLVLKVERDDAVPLTLSMGGRETPVRLDCDVRTGIVVLGNAPYGLLTLAGYGWGFVAAAGLDLWTGAAYGCPERVRFEVPAPASPPPVCRVLLVLPPPHDDYAEQDRVVRAWADSTRAARGPCDRVVPTAQVRPELARLGLGAHDPREVDRGRLNKLAEQTGATHVVGLRWAADAAGTRIEGEVRDVFTDTRAAAPVGFDPAPPPDDGFSWRSLWKYLYLLPNSVAFAPSVTNPVPTPAEGYDSVTLEYHASLPALLTGWTLTSAEHPDQFDSWDAHWKLTPSVGLGVLDVTWTATPADDADVPAYADRSTTWFIRGYAELGGVFHTPLGALDLHLLLGGVGVYQEALGAAPADFRGAFEAGLGAAYTAFLGERLFLRLAVAGFGSGDPTIEHPAFSVDQYGVATVALGYYLPETRWWLRSLAE